MLDDPGRNYRETNKQLNSALSRLDPVSCKLRARKSSGLRRKTNKAGGIQVVYDPHCPNCNCSRLWKFGCTRFGNPRLKCAACKHAFVAKRVERYEAEERQHITDTVLVDGMSVRATHRIFGVNRITLARWIQNTKPKE